jgi:hypothetical protein
METSLSLNSSEVSWLNFLQEALEQHSEPGDPQNYSSLSENPRFLKVVLVALLSAIDEKCAFNGVEITRVIDLDYLAGIEDHSEIAFRVVPDYSGRKYLLITARDQSFPLKRPESAKPLKFHSPSAP